MHQNLSVQTTGDKKLRVSRGTCILTNIPTHTQAIQTYSKLKSLEYTNHNGFYNLTKVARAMLSMTVAQALIFSSHSLLNSRTS